MSDLSEGSSGVGDTVVFIDPCSYDATLASALLEFLALFSIDDFCAFTLCGRGFEGFFKTPAFLFASRAASQTAGPPGFEAEVAFRQAGLITVEFD
jgi:hypothetical protein